MKITKKVTSLLLVMLLALSTFAVAITATAAVPSLPSGPVTLYIHKYLNYADKSPVDQSSIGLTNQTGEKLSEGIPESAKAINGVTFQITKCGDINTKVADDAAAPGASGNPAKTNTTFTATTKTTSIDGVDEKGVATFSIDSDNYGLYYVEEIDGDDEDDYDFIKYKAKSFWVYVPMTNPEGTDWMKTIHTYPKNVYTTGAAAAVKSIDKTTYISRLQELRIFDGAVIVLHRETTDYAAAVPGGAAASGEETIARFGLAFTSNNTSYDPAKNNETGAEDAPTKVNVAWVQIGDTGAKKYASDATFGGAGAQTVTINDPEGSGVNNKWESFGYVSATATPTATQASEDPSAEFGIEFSNLEATVTNDGKMIVNGLPAGKYHWHEEKFTRLYATEANDYGGGLQNNYKEWRECGSLLNKNGKIGDNAEVTIAGTEFGEITILSETHALSFSGSAKSEDLNTIENTVGIQIDKETNDDSEDHKDIFVSNDEGAHQDEDCFDYGVGDYAPYRLDIKLPKDNQLTGSATDKITFTDTLSNGLKLQNDGKAYEAKRFKGETGGLNNAAADGYTNSNGLVVNAEDHKQAFTFMVSYAEVTTKMKDWNDNKANYESQHKTQADIVGADGGHVNVTKDILATTPLVDVKIAGQTSTFEITSKENYAAIIALFSKLGGANANFMDDKTPVLEIYYDAQITEDAVISTKDDEFSATNGNMNTFKLDFGTQTGEQKAYVFTGGAKLVKYDANTYNAADIADKLLAGQELTGMEGVNGAKYQVYPGNFDSKAALQEAIKTKGLKPIVFVKKTVNENTVYVKAENQEAEITGDTVTDLTTVTNGTQDGALWFTGLKFADYTVVEVASPKSTATDPATHKSVDNYELNNNVFVITINETSYAASRADDYMPDVPTPRLPLTGGIGTIIFTVVGLALIGGAAFFFIRSRRNKEDEA